jgi:hypothetical protein
MTPQSTLADQIKEEARRLGFDAVGIARLPTPPPVPSPPAQDTIFPMTCL